MKYLYVRGQKILVTDEVYKVYWKETEKEKYQQQAMRKNGLLFFSSLDHDGHFVENIKDENIDIEKVIETEELIQKVRAALAKLNDEERDIVMKLFYNDESINSIAKEKGVSRQAIQWKKNHILKKLKKIIEN